MKDDWIDKLIDEPLEYVYITDQPEERARKLNRVIARLLMEEREPTVMRSCGGCEDVGCRAKQGGLADDYYCLDEYMRRVKTTVFQSNDE